MIQSPTILFDRRTEDVGNLVEFGHLNVSVPDQQQAITFYVMGLGLTHDPFINSGVVNAWIKRSGEESNRSQYRFQDIVDLETGVVLATIEHEVRSMRHPMYGRSLVNRDPSITNRCYATGHELLHWAMRPEVK